MRATGRDYPLKYSELRADMPTSAVGKVIARVTQRDILEEGVCDRDLLHKRVPAIGAYVSDMEHEWNEIHPVTSISVIGGSE